MRIYKNLIFVFILLTMITSVSATTFSEDTEFTQGNVNYIFKEGIEVDTFDISSGGIKINGDKKIGITTQGGELTVIFYEFDEDDKLVGFESSVPQKIDFEVSFDGVNQYLYDGTSHYYNNFYIDDNMNFSFSPKETSLIKSTSEEISDKITKLEWWQKKIVEFEISSSIEKGILTTKTFTITYMSFTIFMVIILLLILLWRVVNS